MIFMIMTLFNDRQNMRNGINPTNENTIACNEANASIVNCSNSGAVSSGVAASHDNHDHHKLSIIHYQL